MLAPALMASDAAGHAGQCRVFRLGALPGRTKPAADGIAGTEVVHAVPPEQRVRRLAIACGLNGWGEAGGVEVAA